jgi:hypothetical protein
MGKKKHRHGWPEAKKLCRLNQNDIAMAKSLGFGPDALVRARPGPRQKWKLPVKYWIHELHFKRFGYVLGEKPLPAPQRSPPRPKTTRKPGGALRRSFTGRTTGSEIRTTNLPNAGQSSPPRRRLWPPPDPQKIPGWMKSL